jgi:hypothetical protein
MRGALTFAVRDMDRVGMIATATRWVMRRGCQTGKSFLVRPQPGCSDQQRSGKTPGRWLSFGLLALDKISKNRVGRTGFEPVTSSVSECRPSSLSSEIGVVTWAYPRRALFGLPSVSCAYLYDPQRSRAVVGPSLGHVHGSGGRRRHSSNLAAGLGRLFRGCPSTHGPFRICSGSCGDAARTCTAADHCGRPAARPLLHATIRSACQPCTPP